MLTFDAAKTAWLKGKLADVDFGGFTPPTEPQVRTSEDIRDVIRPSAMSKCERALALKASTLPVSETWSVQGLTAVDFGSHVHKRIQAVIPGEHEVRVQGPWLRGSLDTRFGETVLDYKTINAKGAKAVEKAGQAQVGHELQVTWYARQNQAPGAAVVYLPKPASGELTIEIGKLTVYSGRVDFDAPHPYDLRAERILAHVEAGTIPEYAPTAEMLGFGGECKYCPMKSACWARMPIEREQNSKIVGAYAAEDPARMEAFLALRRGDRLTLIWEPANEFGPRLSDDETRACAVMVVDPHGRQVGYLPATESPTADQVARHLRDGGKAVAVVAECTGGDEAGGRANHGRNVAVLLS